MANDTEEDVFFIQFARADRPPKRWATWWFQFEDKADADAEKAFLESAFPRIRFVSTSFLAGVLWRLHWRPEKKRPVTWRVISARDLRAESAEEFDRAQKMLTDVKPRGERGWARGWEPADG